mgnify:CR=1 FL=1
MTLLSRSIERHVRLAQSAGRSKSTHRTSSPESTSRWLCRVEHCDVMDDRQVRICGSWCRSRSSFLRAAALSSMVHKHPDPANSVKCHQDDVGQMENCFKCYRVIPRCKTCVKGGKRRFVIRYGLGSSCGIDESMTLVAFLVEFHRRTEKGAFHSQLNVQKVRSRSHRSREIPCEVRSAELPC